MAHLTHDDIIRTTLEIGEAWAAAHAKRLIERVREIGSDLDYDPQASNRRRLSMIVAHPPNTPQKMWSTPCVRVG